MNMKFQHKIYSEDVRQFCIDNNLYTTGNNNSTDYRALLNSCDTMHNCTPRRIINIAKDIAEHSDEQDSKIDLSVGNIAYHLCDDVMHTVIEIDD